MSMNLPFRMFLPFNCPDNIAPHLEKVFTGEYDIPVYINSPRILDLGANYGAFSLWSLHRFPHSKIWAYEPDPNVYVECLKNLEPYLNHIKMFNHGIGTPGERTLFLGRNNPGENSLFSEINGSYTRNIQVKIEDPLTLPEADIIKLDIEGCEMEVLRPLIEAGRTFTLILLEYHSHKLRREVDELLEDYELIGAEVQSALGRGVMKYARKGLF